MRQATTVFYQEGVSRNYKTYGLERQEARPLRRGISHMFPH